MNGWIVFQLLVDVALFAIIVVYLIRSGHQHKIEIDDLVSQQPEGEPQVDPDQIEKLLDELARLVMRAEKVAVRIEKGVEVAQGTEESKASPAKAETNPPDEKPASSKPGAKAPSKNPLDEEQYRKAAKLIKKGMTDDDIGKIVGLPSHEISLIRRMGS